MNVYTKLCRAFLFIATMTGSLGLVICSAGAQEGHEEARPIIVTEEASGDNPFEARRDRERAEAREGTEAREREQHERPTERDILRQQVEVLKIALHGLREAEKMDAAELVQRAIRAREVALEGRRDDEAHMIRERAPGQLQLKEVLQMASNVWREFNNQERAVAVGRLAETMTPRPRGEEMRRARAEEGAQERTERPSEHEVARRQLEIMRVALPALREGDRADAVELMERAIHAHEVMLEGRRDDEAHRIRERMPNRGQMAEILTTASNLWREFNNHEKAEIVGRLAREFRGHAMHREQLARERRPERREAPPASEEVERLKGSVRELSGQMSEIRREMAEIRKLLQILAEQKRDDQ